MLGPAPKDILGRNAPLQGKSGTGSRRRLVWTLTPWQVPWACSHPQFSSEQCAQLHGGCFWSPLAETCFSGLPSRSQEGTCLEVGVEAQLLPQGKPCKPSLAGAPAPGSPRPQTLPESYCAPSLTPCLQTPSQCLLGTEISHIGNPGSVHLLWGNRTPTTPKGGPGPVRVTSKQAERVWSTG